MLIETDRQTDRDRQTDTDRQTETDRQTQTDRQRQTDRQTDRIHSEKIGCNLRQAIKIKSKGKTAINFFARARDGWRQTPRFLTLKANKCSAVSHTIFFFRFVPKIFWILPHFFLDSPLRTEKNKKRMIICSE